MLASPPSAHYSSHCTSRCCVAINFLSFFLNFTYISQKLIIGRIQLQPRESEGRAKREAVGRESESPRHARRQKRASEAPCRSRKKRQAGEVARRHQKKGRPREAAAHNGQRCASRALTVHTGRGAASRASRCRAEGTGWLTCQLALVIVYSVSLITVRCNPIPNARCSVSTHQAAYVLVDS
jgi:hypothetical protein